MIGEPCDVASLDRIKPGAEADQLATAVYAALLDDLDQVRADQWELPTECTGWTVRDMLAHLVGAAEGHASLLVFMRQYVWGMRHRGEFAGSSLDAMNQGQLNVLAGTPPQDLLALLRSNAPKAVAGRARRARLLGWAPISLDEAGSWYPGMPTKTTMGELCAVVLTRDAWAHRLDLARALDRQVRVDPAIDGRIVADIVTDWAHRHARPFTLELTGETGGLFQSVAGDERQATRASASRSTPSTSAGTWQAEGPNTLCPTRLCWPPAPSSDHRNLAGRSRIRLALDRRSTCSGCHQGTLAGRTSHALVHRQGLRHRPGGWRPASGRHRARVSAPVATAHSAIRTTASSGSSGDHLLSLGYTQVTVAPSTLAALTSLGVSPGIVAPTKLASAKPLSVRFPITGINLFSLSIRHSGGLTLSAGSTTVTISNLTIDLLRARVSGEVAGVGRVDLFKISRSYSALGLVKLTLTATAASALDGAFGTTALTENFLFGYATPRLFAHI